MEPGLFNLVLGLLGFIEPCWIGAGLLFLQYVGGKDARTKTVQAVVFTLTRAIFIGALAAILGAAFIRVQKSGLDAAWGALPRDRNGLSHWPDGDPEALARPWPEAALRRQWRSRCSGLNIPACAAPLLFAILGMAAADGAVLDGMATAFLSLGL